LNLRPRLGTETLASGRGLIFLAAMSGVALLAADGITSLARLHTLLRRVVHAAAFVALTAVVQFFTGFNASASINVPGLVRNTLVGDHDRSLFVRAQGTATHPIELGGLLGFVLPVAVHYALMARGRRAKVIAWAEVVTIATALIMAISRTGAVAAAIGLISLSFEWSWRRRGKALAATFGFLVVLRGLVPGLVGTLTSSFTKINEDTSTQDRVSRYAIAGHYFRQHPWFGRGFATLYPATHQVFDNTWLYVATELGVFGVVALVLFFLIMIFTARGARMRSTELLTHGAAQALVGMLVLLTAAMLLLARVFALGFLADFLSRTVLVGFLAGVGGAFLSLSYPGSWNQGLSSGQGLMAVALVIFARWDPLRCVLAALLFGAAGALGPSLQAVGVTQGYYFFNAAPYILTLCLMIATSSAKHSARDMPGELSMAK